MKTDFSQFEIDGKNDYSYRVYHTITFQNFAQEQITLKITDFRSTFNDAKPPEDAKSDSFTLEKNESLVLFVGPENQYHPYQTSQGGTTPQDDKFAINNNNVTSYSGSFSLEILNGDGQAITLDEDNKNVRIYSYLSTHKETYCNDGNCETDPFNNSIFYGELLFWRNGTYPDSATKNKTRNENLSLRYTPNGGANNSEYIFVNNPEFLTSRYVLGKNCNNDDDPECNKALYKQYLTKENVEIYYEGTPKSDVTGSAIYGLLFENTGSGKVTLKFNHCGVSDNWGYEDLDGDQLAETIFNITTRTAIRVP